METRKNLERTQPVNKAFNGFLKIEETKKALLNSARRPRTRSRSNTTGSATPATDINLDELTSEAGDHIDVEREMEKTLEQMLNNDSESVKTCEESLTPSDSHLFAIPKISPRRLRTMGNEAKEQCANQNLVEKDSRKSNH